MLLVGVLLYFKYEDKYLQKSWGYFFLLTGIAAGVAAFGHLEILPTQTQGYLLFLSRVLNILSMLAFITGIRRHFGYHQRVYTYSNAVLFFGVLIWLSYLNILFLGSKQAFTPVILYSVIGMLVIGVPHFILALKRMREGPLFILLGIAVMAVAAVVFKLMPEGSGMKPSDISHVLIALSLISFSEGFKLIKLNEN